ncbi:hypothetical protein BDK51DRAFT_26738 [Blyttiomyces helicus]|uniref:Uncharacterized protein n=1 Tax=Blyttiomyces helicus TaxID=388810 RepID=A0A4P9WA00_9FUNG|nr:hypothetical protein BDK51DRAFT_26738 [Blyttiomyces helicus]|eukprot:RKO87056.1 hypothetical protein BDK51DRAFT_26738 [Blyttiomyces helicus]
MLVKNVVPFEKSKDTEDSNHLRFLEVHFLAASADSKFDSKRGKEVAAAVDEHDGHVVGHLEYGFHAPQFRRCHPRTLKVQPHLHLEVEPRLDFEVEHRLDLKVEPRLDSEVPWIVAPVFAPSAQFACEF